MTGEGETGGRYWRTTTKASALALGIATTVCTPSSAGSEPAYAGPTIVKSEEYGALDPRQERTVNLVSGKADFIGACRTAVPCSPDEHRTFIVPAGELAKMRALAIAVRQQGLFDTACIKRREKRAEAERRHEGARPKPAPFTRDPSWANFMVEGVGEVSQGPDLASFKLEVSCISPTTEVLWNAITSL